MNLKCLMTKLQRTILTTGLVIKIGTGQFYSPEQDRMITMYILSTPVLQYGRNGWKVKDYEILRTASQIDTVKCLAEIWEQVKEWAVKRNETDAKAEGICR